MRRPRPIRIPQRRRVFVGCEGESEQGYVALLSRLLEERHRQVFLDAVLLGGGDPLALVETARLRLRHRRERGDRYAARVIFLDSDQREISPERTAQAIDLAANLDLQLIWQEPCHEALLLRHFPDCERHRPPTTRLAGEQLLRLWPEYRKAMPAAPLAVRLDREAVLRAASVEAALAAFLAEIAFGVLLD